MGDITNTNWADVFWNGDFYCVLNRLGYHWGSAYDLDRDPKFLTPDTSDAALGVAILDALSFGRFLREHESVKYRDKDLQATYYDQLVRTLMDRHGYKNRRALFKNMQLCHVRRSDGIITIVPTNHDKLEGWGRTKSDGIEDVRISSSQPPAEVGAALRLAFTRCI